MLEWSLAKIYNDDALKLLNSYSQELIDDELIEMCDQDQDIEEPDCPDQLPLKVLTRNV